MAMAVCDSEILRTIRNGTRKKRMSQRNGIAVAIRRCSGVRASSATSPALSAREAELGGAGSQEFFRPIHRLSRLARRHKCVGVVIGSDSQLLKLAQVPSGLTQRFWPVFDHEAKLLEDRAVLLGRVLVS